MKKLVLCLLVALVVTNCAHHANTVKISAGYINQDQPDSSKTNHFFLHGWFQNDNTEAYSMCGNNQKVKAVKTETTSLNRLLAIITGGIYTPTTTRVWCENK